MTKLFICGGLLCLTLTLSTKGVNPVSIEGVGRCVHWN